MKITALRTYPVPPRWLFLRIDTDEGVTGWGEPIVEGRLRTVAAAVAECAEYLVGKDPLRIEDHWQVLTKGTFYRGGPVLSSAVAGIDQALWDIAGKVHGVPVHVLLGGPVRERARVYSWIGGDEPNHLAEAAQARVDEGMTAVKMNASAQLRLLDTPAQVRAIVERVETVRETVGPDVDVAIDFHGRLSLAMSRRVLPLLEPYLPMFVEEPILPELSHRLREVAASTSVPIATGERLYSRWDFRPVLESGVSVIQPDLSHAGGISEVRRIAAMAEVYDVAVAPHCPLGPIALAASLQVGFATPNYLIQEQSIGLHYGEGHDLLDYLVDRSVLTHKNGFIDRFDGPGLGIEIDERVVERVSRYADEWRTPIWRRDDGSLAEW
ncbi:galactonate dehydratase [Thermasporomyces composti]|jgi:galactonate dehydratase|uniref:Galactonate dehydratase n=1 Tax=Thermasporomyces composti TaxID=696763 RepID=A0A3D9VDQ1_THECX|nr:galactonate dehydratase [Thermasporomyces composti]REF35441.1 galactonate dehydratase [Thermasporomyces composti]